MNKEEILIETSKGCGYSLEEVTNVINSFMKLTRSHVTKGDKVVYINFGIFFLHYIGPRKSIYGRKSFKGRYSVLFRASDSWKKSIRT